MKIKVNSLNSIHLSGKVYKVKTFEDKSIVVGIETPVRNTSINARVMAKIDHPNIPVKQGDWIYVQGNLRHSVKTNTYKIVSSVINKSNEHEHINIAYMEVYLTKIDQKDQGYLLTGCVFNTAKNGGVYILPLEILINEKQYKSCHNMLNIHNRYIVEGVLLGAGKIKGIHIKAADSITADLDLDTFIKER